MTIFNDNEIEELAAAQRGEWLPELYELHKKMEARTAAEDAMKAQQAARNLIPKRMTRAEANQLFAQYWRPKATVERVKKRTPGPSFANAGSLPPRRVVRTP